MCWNKYILSIGSSNGKITHYDSKSNQLISSNFAHPREITNLVWSPDGNQLASVSSNLVKVWELNSNSACCIIRHNEPVCSLAWCPWKVDYLATVCLTTGTFRIWNTLTGEIVSSMELIPNITSLSWCSHKKEFLTTQTTSENALILWKFPSLQKFKTFSSPGGILSSTQNPKNKIIVTSARDTILTLWQILEPKSNPLVNVTKSNVF
jgi:cell division cycle protein 20 (cofactor of APC complex)